MTPTQFDNRVGKNSITKQGRCYSALTYTVDVRKFFDPSAKAFLIIADKVMSRRQHEIAAISETGAVVVLCTKTWNQQSDIVERARMMVWWWPMILHCSVEADRGSFLELPWANTVKALKRWRA